MAIRTDIPTILIALVCLGAIFFGFAPHVHAQDESGMISYGQCQGAGGFVPLACFNDSQKLTGLYNSPNLSDYLNKLFIFAISLGAMFAVLRLAWAGYEYMVSDIWSNKEHAKEIIQDTLLGLLLLLAVWLILHQINPDILKLGNLNVDIKPLAPVQQQAGEVPCGPDGCVQN